MQTRYSLIGKDLYIDSYGKMFAKVASEMVPMQDKFIQAEERFVQNQLEKGAISHESE